MSHSQYNNETKNSANPELACYFNTHELFAQGTDAHIKGLLIDLDDPYYGREKVDFDTEKLVEFHKQELVQQAVAFRCPPEKDKNALAIRYATISKKKMSEVLDLQKSSRSGKKPKKTSSDHQADIEKELKEMEIEMAIEARDQEERQKRELSARDGFADTATHGAEDEYLHKEKPMTAEGMEFDDYLLLDHLDDDYDSDAVESPYRRKSGTASRRSMNRPPSHKRTSTGKDDGNVKTYHDKHGSAGWRAELMAPTPVRNPSAKYLLEQNKRKKDSARDLYLHALDEAMHMQERYLTCVSEANVFSQALNKGNVYRVMERDPLEDQHWKNILDPQKAKLAKSIPKGTGQRIAKMLVEVSNPDRDIRYLSTGHFFREHGRLQHELQKKCAVDGLPADMLLGSLNSDSGADGSEGPSAIAASPRNRRPKSSSHLTSPSKDSVSILPSKSRDNNSISGDSDGNMRTGSRAARRSKQLPTVLAQE